MAAVMTWFRVASVAAAFTLLAPPAAWAWDTLTKKDIEVMLADPGVKLLAVEFFATWCEPCKRAIPKWIELQKKYRPLGLRLVVVSVQSDGSCSSPEWHPDRVVCDEDGSIQQKWKANKLPQAFLWSWQGNLLVAHGHVEQIEGAVANYFEDTPRILIDEPTDDAGEALPAKAAKRLKTMIRAELHRAAKFDIVADHETRRELREFQRETFDPNYESQCDLGRDVSPNSVLKTRLSPPGDNRRLRLELFSLERKCLSAAASAPVPHKKLDMAVVESVNRLVRNLVGEIGKPETVVAATPVPPPPPPPPPPPRLAITSVPSTAAITVTGPNEFKEIAVGVWRREGLAPGEYAVHAEAPGYESQRQTLQLAVGDAKSSEIALVRLGELKISGTPEGAKVEISGPSGFEATATVPATVQVPTHGSYAIKVAKEGYESLTHVLDMEPGKSETVPVALKPVPPPTPPPPVVVKPKPLKKPASLPPPPRLPPPVAKPEPGKKKAPPAPVLASPNMPVWPPAAGIGKAVAKADGPLQVTGGAGGESQTPKVGGHKVAALFAVVALAAGGGAHYWNYQINSSFESNDLLLKVSSGLTIAGYAAGGALVVTSIALWPTPVFTGDGASVIGQLKPVPTARFLVSPAAVNLEISW